MHMLHPYLLFSTDGVSYIYIFKISVILIRIYALLILDLTDN